MILLQEYIMKDEKINVFRSLSFLAHLQIYKTWAYQKISSKLVLKTQKMKFRTHIKYFVEYDFTNIFRIWISHLKKIIHAWDVIFDEIILFNLDKSYITEQLKKLIRNLAIQLKYEKIKEQQLWFY